MQTGLTSGGLHSQGVAAQRCTPDRLPTNVQKEHGINCEDKKDAWASHRFGEELWAIRSWAGASAVSAAELPGLARRCNVSSTRVKNPLSDRFEKLLLRGVPVAGIFCVRQLLPPSHRERCSSGEESASASTSQYQSALGKPSSSRHALAQQRRSAMGSCRLKMKP